jgi:hypothetical protein
MHFAPGLDELTRIGGPGQRKSSSRRPRRGSPARKLPADLMQFDYRVASVAALCRSMGSSSGRRSRGKEQNSAKRLWEMSDIVDVLEAWESSNA